MISRVRIGVTFALMVTMCFAFAGPGLAYASVQQSARISAPATAQPSTLSHPIFAWVFGYIGDTFWPQANNSISPDQVVSLAANLSNAVGSSNLRLVCPVVVMQGHNVQAQYIPTIKAFVDALRLHVSVVYARVYALQFPNETSMYTEVSLLVKQLDINGIFVDLAPILYGNLGQARFNQMFQNLTNSFPGINFIMNEAAKSILIKPLQGTTWSLNTYVMPTVAPGHYTLAGLNLSKVATLNGLFPGHVLAHYDADANWGNGEPMAVFADQSSSNEISALKELTYSGDHPSAPQYSFSFLYPVLGAWTSIDSNYHGTLYNSLNVGTYARSTVSAIMGVMSSEKTSSTTATTSTTPVHTTTTSSKTTTTSVTTADSTRTTTTSTIPTITTTTSKHASSTSTSSSSATATKTIDTQRTTSVTSASSSYSTSTTSSSFSLTASKTTPILPPPETTTTATGVGRSEANAQVSGIQSFFGFSIIILTVAILAVASSAGMVVVLMRRRKQTLDRARSQP